MIIELLYLFIRNVILKPLGLLKESEEDAKKENEWLEKIGYLKKDDKDNPK
ncbi:MAG: hypothetical protein AAB573_03670 [Patescibacteria group bacterium]